MKNSGSSMVDLVNMAQQLQNTMLVLTGIELLDGARKPMQSAPSEEVGDSNSVLPF